MSWLYLPEAAADYTEACCSDTLPSALLSSCRITETCSCSDSATACSRDSPCGMTFAPLTATLGADASISLAASSLVRTSAQPEKVQALTANEADCGAKWRGSFAKYNPDSRLWKTAQCSLLADSDVFSETWPRWGSMRNGECWELTTSAHLTSATEFGLWPTPVASDLGDRKAKYAQGGTPLSLAVKWPTPRARDAQPEGLQAGIRRMDKYSTCSRSTAVALERFPTPKARDYKGSAKDRTPDHPRHADNLDSFVERADNAPTGRLNPEFVEWLMGWPIGATALSALETGRFQEWLQQHGECLEAHE